jgi:hypothetical protein
MALSQHSKSLSNLIWTVAISAGTLDNIIFSQNQHNNWQQSINSLCNFEGW